MFIAPFEKNSEYTLQLKKLAEHFAQRGDNVSVRCLKFLFTKYIDFEADNISKHWEDFLRSLSGKKIVCYGAGVFFSQYCRTLANYNVKIEAVLDKNKQGVCCGYPIISVDEYKENHNKTPILITIDKPEIRVEIRDFLQLNGITDIIEDSLFMTINPYTYTLTEAKALTELSGEQYFIPEIICDNMLFVDCGAFCGETSLAFVKCCEQNDFRYKKIIAFEPDKSNFLVARDSLADIPNIDIQNFAISEKTCQKKFNSNASSSATGFGDQIVECISIDEYLNNTCKDIDYEDAILFIKMDIETDELEALRGAKSTIVSKRPRLAICVYHQVMDVLDISKFVWDLNPDYKLFLRHHMVSMCETVLYAI